MCVCVRVCLMNKISVSVVSTASMPTTLALHINTTLQHKYIHTDIYVQHYTYILDLYVYIKRSDINTHRFYPTHVHTVLHAHQ